MKLDVKICGLSTADAVAAALSHGASHVGFIFFRKSPRYVAPERAAELRQAARGRAKAVAVTVDENDETIDAIVAAMAPDMLQLHGRETPERVAQLKARHGLPVMKALSVSEKRDLAAVRDYAGIADRLLLDAKPPKGAVLPGGNAVAFDWNILAALPAGTDYLLAGGIHPGNVAEALAVADPPGIDVSSGVESAPGVKDIERIAGLFAAIRAAGR